MVYIHAYILYESLLILHISGDNDKGDIKNVNCIGFSKGCTKITEILQCTAMAYINAIFFIVFSSTATWKIMQWSLDAAD